MKELIGAALVIAGLYYGKVEEEQILKQVRLEALSKAGQGLPPLSNFTRRLTNENRSKRNSN